MLIYVDEYIIFSKQNSTIDHFIFFLDNFDKNRKKEFKFTDEWLLQNYIGAELTKHKNGTMEMKQEFLIERIVAVLGFDNNHMNAGDNPAVRAILHKD